MPVNELTRRKVLESLLATPLGILDWNECEAAQTSRKNGEAFDAVIIGAGLGGLGCAAALTRKGFRPLIIEQHDKPGGYATAFERPGGFKFDVSLHSTSVGERNGVRNLIGGFPEIEDVEFVPHPHLYRAIFPKHDIRVPQRDVPAYAALLKRSFPEEKAGIDALLADMRAMSDEVGRLRRGRAPDMRTFPTEYPVLFERAGQTWGQMVNARLRDPKLKAIVSELWMYYGLPPSKLSSFYYALPTLGYLEQGGYYPKGRSQNISDALVKVIENRGGKVMLNTRVERILVQDGTAGGVRCAGGLEFGARAVVSNACARQTFHQLLEDAEVAQEYRDRMAGFSTSLSCFQVFLGLNKDLAGQLGIKDSEIFVESGYDPDAAYEAARSADIEKAAFAVTLYDNLFPGYSPKGKNTLNILTLQGFDHWEQFEVDYRKGRKEAYRAEKERMAKALIRRAEEKLLPGLSKAIEIEDAGTPLTNMRYTGNHRGAIYGWDQTVTNSGLQRVGCRTPIRNLFLASAWADPGHGYGGVLASGLICSGEVMRSWS